MESRVIRLSKGDAVRLARRGSFHRSPSFSASKSARGAFGEGLVKGWLKSLGYEIRDRPLLIRATDLGLNALPSQRRFRLVEITTADENLAVEVKTYGSHSLQGSAGDTLEDQLADVLLWRREVKGRILALAVVHYYGNPVISGPDLDFIKTNRIPILRFVILGMSY